MPQIENCTITEYYSQSTGLLRAYLVSANDGYVLHDRLLDIVETRPATDEELSRLPGYTSGSCSCQPSYDWEENPREFYAVPRKEKNRTL